MKGHSSRRWSGQIKESTNSNFVQATLDAINRGSWQEMVNAAIAVCM